MPKVEIDDIPQNAYQILVGRATKANLSLPEYLRSVLIADAEKLTLDEEFERARR